MTQLRIAVLAAALTCGVALAQEWGYVKSGRQVGSYTVCALFKKMPRDQAEYYRKAHGFDC